METNQITDKIKQINSGIDFKRLLGSVTTKWYWFVISITFFMTAGWLYLRYTTPVYSMRSSILIDEQQRTTATTVLNSLGNNNNNQGPNMFNEMFVMRSQDLVGAVVDSMGLNVRYYTQGRIKEDEIYETCPIVMEFDTAGYTGLGLQELRLTQIVDGLFEFTEGRMVSRILYNTWVRRPYGRFRLLYRKGQEVNKGYLSNNTEIILRIDNHKAVTEQMIGKFGVNVSDARTSLLDLYFTDNIKRRGVEFLNTLIYFYRKKELQDVVEYLQKSGEFIDERKAEIARSIRAIDSAEVRIKLDNNVVDLTSQTSNLLTEKALTEKNIQALMDQKQIVQKLQDNILDGVGTRYEILAGIGVADPVLTNLVAQYNAAIQRKEVLNKSNPDKNPYVLKAIEEIAAFRKQIADAAERVIGSLDISLRNASRNLYESDVRLQDVPNVDKDMVDARRGYEVQTSTYLLLSQKEIENKISQYAATNKSKVVVTPYVIDDPISPVKNNIYAMMFLLGVMIPGSVVVARVMLNNKVTNETDIEILTSIPVIGSISKAEEGQVKKNIVVGPHIRTGIAEQFRLIRANLEFMASANSKRVFLITSSMSGEGKTFVSLNLGITMTLAKKRVVIMEFDLRKPKLSSYLGVQNEGGISGYLAGIHGMDKVLKASGVHENLYIANCGPIPPNPGELLVLPTTKQLIEELQEMFDVIIIDTAPLGLVSDALILSQFTDVNIFIVRQGYTVRDQIKMFDNLYNEKKIRNAAAIFNGVEYLSKYGYGYGGAYGYGYNYASGGYYDDSSPKKKPSLAKRLFSKTPKKGVTS